tara:strand:- start:26 stop:214 length:189 start_codon:yes stop_codon:yes gene_type:complete
MNKMETTQKFDVRSCPLKSNGNGEGCRVNNPHECATLTIKMDYRTGLRNLDNQNKTSGVYVK